MNGNDYVLRANQSTLDTEKRTLQQQHMFYRVVYGCRSQQEGAFSCCLMACCLTVSRSGVLQLTREVRRWKGCGSAYVVFREGFGKWPHRELSPTSLASWTSGGKVGFCFWLWYSFMTWLANWLKYFRLLVSLIALEIFFRLWPQYLPAWVGVSEQSESPLTCSCMYFNQLCSIFYTVDLGTISH